MPTEGANDGTVKQGFLGVDVSMSKSEWVDHLMIRTSTTLHHGRPFAADFSGELQAKSVPPISNRFVADLDATFVQKIFDVSQWQRKPHVQHHRQADEFGAAVKVLE